MRFSHEVHLKDAFDVDARGHNRVGIQFAWLYQFLHLGDGDARGGGHHGVEIARRPAIDQVALPVALPGLYQREVCFERRLQHVLAPIEGALLFALRDQGAYAGGSVEGGNARSAGADPFRQRALRNQRDLQGAGNHQLLQQRVFAHVAAGMGSDHARLQQQAEAEAVHAHVVGNGVQAGHPAAHQGGNRVLWNAAKPESPQHHGCARRDIGNGCVGGRKDFIHSKASLPIPKSQSQASRDHLAI